MFCVNHVEDRAGVKAIRVLIDFYTGLFSATSLSNYCEECWLIHLHISSREIVKTNTFISANIYLLQTSGYLLIHKNMSVVIFTPTFYFSLFSALNRQVLKVYQVPLHLKWNSYIYDQWLKIFAKRLAHSISPGTSDAFYGALSLEEPDWPNTVVLLPPDLFWSFWIFIFKVCWSSKSFTKSPGKKKHIFHFTATFKTWHYSMEFIGIFGM